MTLTIVAVGLVVGFVIGLTSMGGGTLLTPAMVAVGVPPALAIGSNVLAASCVKFVGGAAYAARDGVHWQTVLRLALGSLPGAFSGVLLLNQIRPEVVDYFILNCLGWVLIVAGLANGMLLPRPTRATGKNFPPAYLTSLLGFCIGLSVSVTSVGSGSLLLVFLSLFYCLDARILVGTDLAHAFLLATAATIGHSVSGRVDWVLALTLLCGGVPGVLLGAKLAFQLPERWLRRVLAAVLVSVGCYLIW